MDRKDTVDQVTFLDLILMEATVVEMYLILAQVPQIPKDPDSVESECYNPHKEARKKKKNGVDNPAFRWEKLKTLILHDSYF